MPRRAQDLQRKNGRIEERRTTILHAAAAVFARHGYHKTRTKDIAEEAGVAEGTLYNYFDSKHDLLLALIEHLITESVQEVLAEAEHENLYSLLEAFLRDRLEMLDRNRAFLKAVIPEMITDRGLRTEYLQKVVMPLTEQLMPLAQRALGTRQMQSFNPRVVLPAVIGATVGAFAFDELVDPLSGEASSREALISDLTRFLLDGLHANNHPSSPVG